MKIGSKCGRPAWRAAELSYMREPVVVCATSNGARFAGERRSALDSPRRGTSYKSNIETEFENGNSRRNIYRPQCGLELRRRSNYTLTRCSFILTPLRGSNHIAVSHIWVFDDLATERISRRGASWFRPISWDMELEPITRPAGHLSFWPKHLATASRKLSK